MVGSDYMSKGVLLSIKPQYCELIASGKKTVEVRKTRPKLKTPFKCYIYCTNAKTTGDFILCKSRENAKLFGFNSVKGINKGFAGKEDVQLKGKVIGEFVCDEITSADVCEDDRAGWFVNCMHAFEGSCLTETDILSYCPKENPIYGWCISDLVIFDTPKKLSGFCGMTRPPRSWCYVEELEENA